MNSLRLNVFTTLKGWRLGGDLLLPGQVHYPPPRLAVQIELTADTLKSEHRAETEPYVKNEQQTGRSLRYTEPRVQGAKACPILFHKQFLINDI